MGRHLQHCTLSANNQGQVVVWVVVHTPLGDAPEGELAVDGELGEDGEVAAEAVLAEDAELVPLLLDAPLELEAA